MILHGRLSPGVARPTDVIELRLHVPHRLSGIAIKLFEGDNLLARWTGDLEPGTGPRPNDRDYCKLTVTSSQITAQDPDDVLHVVRIRLPGSSDVIRVPLGSERQELAARPLSLTFSVEQGGAEKFRTGCPCLALIDATPVRFEHHVYGKLNDDRTPDPDELDEGILTHRFVWFGIRHGELMAARLEIVGAGWIDGTGRAIDARPGDDDDRPPQPIYVRRGRKLFAYIHDSWAELASGVSKIPIAACDEVQGDGTVIAVRPDLDDRLTVRVAELGIDWGDRPTYDPDLGQVEGDDHAIDREHLGAFADHVRQLLADREPREL